MICTAVTEIKGVRHRCSNEASVDSKYCHYHGQMEKGLLDPPTKGAVVLDKNIVIGKYSGTWRK